MCLCGILHFPRPYWLLTEGWEGLYPTPFFFMSSYVLINPKISPDHAPALWFPTQLTSTFSAPETSVPWNPADFLSLLLPSTHMLPDTHSHSVYHIDPCLWKIPGLCWLMSSVPICTEAGRRSALWIVQPDPQSHFPLVIHVE